MGFVKKKHMYKSIYDLFYLLKKDILSSQHVLGRVLRATLMYTCSSREDY